MPHPQPERGSWLKAACLPLFFYLSITLVVPAVRGAYRRPEFWEHAAVVLASVGVILTLFAMVRRVLAGARALISGGRSSRSGAGGGR